ncbi:MAG: ATP-grasp domain-containing protein, partial [Gammaproteobacteria bacterium]|nr:ATP-grasp domain-containing protein [Gammaproteobacteria bacterium]
KGQVRVKDFSELIAGWKELNNLACLLEGFVDFDKEVSQVAVRGKDGEIKFYPLAHNIHKNGVLVETNAPYQDDALAELAQRHTRKLLEHFNYVGVLAVEYFVSKGGLIINEMAPRVHNSGHWSIEGALTSQFENHIRAISGLPLGDCSAVGVSKMLNCLGEMLDRAEAMQDLNAHYHDYAKEPRPGRKVGHITYHYLK